MSRVIRPARAEDAAGIARVHVECWREAYGHFLSEEFLSSRTLESYTRGWQRSLAAPEPGVTIAVLDEDGDIRGFAMSGPPVTETEGDKEAAEAEPARELYSIYQFATEHGTGSGAELLEAVLHGAPATLWVAEQAQRARAFYAKNGFVETGERKLESHAENLVALRMSRSAP